MSLAADPPACVVPTAGGNSTHQLTNSGAERLVFKVKSSNNNEYRIKPVFGFVEAGASLALEVIRLAGAAKEDKLVVQFGPVPADSAAAKSCASSKVLFIPCTNRPSKWDDWKEMMDNFIGWKNITKQYSPQMELNEDNWKSGNSKKDRLVVQFGPAPADAADAAAAFDTIAASPAGTITIPLSAQ